MRWLYSFSWTYLVFVVHSGFARELAICGSAPHLALAGLVLMTVRTRGRQGLLLAAGWGLLLDCLGTGRLGVNLVALTLAAMTVQEIHARWPLESPWRLGALAAVVIGTEHVATSSLRMLADGQSTDLRLIVAHAAGSAVYSGFMVALVSLASRMVLERPAAAAETVAPTVSNKWRMLTES